MIAKRAEKVTIIWSQKIWLPSPKSNYGLSIGSSVTFIAAFGVFYVSVCSPLSVYVCTFRLCAWMDVLQKYHLRHAITIRAIICWTKTLFVVLALLFSLIRSTEPLVLQLFTHPCTQTWFCLSLCFCRVHVSSVSLSHPTPHFPRVTVMALDSSEHDDMASSHPAQQEGNPYEINITHTHTHSSLGETGREQPDLLTHSHLTLALLDKERNEATEAELEKGRYTNAHTLVWVWVQMQARQAPHFIFIYKQDGESMYPVSLGKPPHRHTQIQSRSCTLEMLAVLSSLANGWGKKGSGVWFSVFSWKNKRHCFDFKVNNV